MDEFLAAIPREKIIAIGTHGFIKTKQERYEWYCFLEKVLDVNCPSIVIVYGGLNDPMYDEFKTKTRFIFYEPWIYNKGKEVMDNGD